MIIQPLAGLRRGFPLGQVEWGSTQWDDSESHRPETQSPPVDRLAWLELLKEVSLNPRARHHSVVSTAITAQHWDKDQKPLLFFSRCACDWWKGTAGSSVPPPAMSQDGILNDRTCSLGPCHYTALWWANITPWSAHSVWCQDHTWWMDHLMSCRSLHKDTIKY